MYVINDPPVRPTVSPVAITIFIGKLFYFARFRKVGTEGRHVWKYWSLWSVTVGRPRGSLNKKCHSWCRQEKNVNFHPNKLTLVVLPAKLKLNFKGWDIALLCAKSYVSLKISLLLFSSDNISGLLNYLFLRN